MSQSHEAPTADGNVLLALLAYQNDFIADEALITVLNAWAADKSRPLGQLLVERNAISPDVRALLESLVDRHLHAHHNAPCRSLAALSSIGSVRERLKQIADPDVAASMSHMPESADPFATRAPLPSGESVTTSVGAPTSGGLRFRVLRPHARGGLGAVFVAHDEELRREVALKEIQDRHADDPGSRARFLLEAEITGGLEHPGIVPVYGLGSYGDGRPYYAMRFIRGDSLKDAIERFYKEDHPGRDPSERAVAFRKLLGRFIDVCNAIDYAHSRGVLHRDLKPGNIMLGKYGETLVVDWGLAKPLDDRQEGAEEEQRLRPMSASGTAETVAGTAIGTPQFMSPEQAAGRLAELGPASDVYSLGATLYCLLTGQPPFTGDVGGILQRVQRGDFPRPHQIRTDVPRALEAICLKAMALAPPQRYTTPRLLADDAEHWLADEPVAVYREPLLARLARWARRHRTAVASTAVLLVTAVVALTVSTILISQEQNRTETQRKTAVEALQREREAIEARALAQVNALLDANPQAVPNIVKSLEPFQEMVLPRLRELRGRSDLSEKHRARAALALLPIDVEQVPYLRQRMLDAEPAELLLIRDSLTAHGPQLATGLWPLLADPGQPAETRFRAAVALAAFDPSNDAWTAAGTPVAEHLLGSNSLLLGLWADALRPVRSALIGPLGKVFRGPPGERRSLAANLLADFAAGRPDLLADLLLDADAGQYVTLMSRLQAHPERAAVRMEAELAKSVTVSASEDDREALARRQANAAVTLLRLNRAGRLWPLLRHQPDPRVRTHIIHRLGPLGADAKVLTERMDVETDVSVRRALVLSLGEFNEQQLPAAGRQALAAQLLPVYRNDPDTGVHSAVDWLLTRWDQSPELRKIDRQLAVAKKTVERNWDLNGQGQTLAVIRGPVDFDMGSPEGEIGRNARAEPRYRCRIPRSFAVATREVTVDQFRRFLRDHPGVGDPLAGQEQYSPHGDGPILNLSWFDAVKYCRWLSEQERIPEAQMCYPPIEQIKEGMKLPKDYLTRTGYRLPTEAEWEYACRAGATTAYSFGASDDLLGQYAWSLRNSSERGGECARPGGRLKPNDLGLFDVHGNVYEWCQDRVHPYPKNDGQASEDREDKVLLVHNKEDATDSRIFRGGSFVDLTAMLRSAYRDNTRPTNRVTSIGLRVARTMP
ncbi:MAG: SUMF1/EgtB/PvdO family nonheme iron enzyme [Gemmataceae bacterium]|nr:SUMF1/EgtB/PvdO family nonheme iron enzyme [Gemmataceae bacterium]